MTSSCLHAAAAGLVAALLMSAAAPVAARPEYLTRFQADPMRRAEVDGCGACHVRPTGGGARNPFGIAFENAAREITPPLRAAFPSHFAFPQVTLADGAVLAFSDPKSQVVVIERQQQHIVADLKALTAVREAPLPLPANRMGFFVTSQPLESLADVGGLAGADRYCQALAKDAGAGERTWRAYLSTSFADKVAVNAGDRIGAGPWYTAKGQIMARGPADLHARGSLPAELLMTEKGERLLAGGESAATELTILTGTMANGTAAVGQNCANWTTDAEGQTVAADLTRSWNSARTVACQTPAAAPAAKPRLYCFAAR